MQSTFDAKLNEDFCEHFPLSAHSTGKYSTADEMCSSSCNSSPYGVSWVCWLWVLRNHRRKSFGENIEHFGNMISALEEKNRSLRTSTLLVMWSLTWIMRKFDEKREKPGTWICEASFFSLPGLMVEWCSFVCLELLKKSVHLSVLKWNFVASGLFLVYGASNPEWKWMPNR